MSTIKEKIQAAKLPERTVPLCLNFDLQAEFEQAEAALQDEIARPRDSLAAGSRVAELAERVTAIEAQMRDEMVDFVLRAMPRRRWKRFVDAYPPRKDESGDVLAADKFIGVNTETFFPALIRESVVGLDDDDWRKLLGDDDEEYARLLAEGKEVEEGTLTDQQFDKLADVAWSLNRRDLDVPFSRAASRVLANSDTE